MSNGGTVLVGNNEDYNLEGNIWFVPPSGNKNGRITFGFDNGWSQGGMNDKGLFFDWAATTQTAWEYSAEKITYMDHTVRGAYHICEMIMEECSSTEEAIEIFNRYNVPGLKSSHPMFVDQTGGSAIIEWGNNALAVQRKDKSYQVLTNFNLSNPSIGWFPCWRYNLVNKILEENIEPTVELFRTILDTVHQEGQYHTVYSNVYDVKNGDIYVYHKYNFDEVLKIHIQNELKKGSRTFKLFSLFSNIKMIYPEHKQMIRSNSLTFKWSGSGKMYELYYSTHLDFKDCQPIRVFNSVDAGFDNFIFFSLFFILFSMPHVVKIPRYFLCIVIIMGMILFSCEKNENILSGGSSSNGIFQYTVHALKSNSLYYWKICPMNSKELKTESVIKSFTTFN